MHVRVRKGLTIPITGEPEQRIYEADPVAWVALVARDYRGLRPRLEVEVGERVCLGQPILTDKNNPGVVFTAPGCGEVVAIHHGERRSLQSLVIRLEGDQEERFTTYDRGALTTLDRDEVRQLLLSSGLWTSFRARPFGKIPTADASPHSIFVTAIDTNPLSGDPRVVISERAQDFSDGVAVLSRLTDGKVYVCQAPGPELQLPKLNSVTPAIFDGPHPAGLPGTHIHFLDPVGENKSVWHLSYQDVIAIGSLFTTGRLSTERIVALGGPVVLRPRLIRTRIGASTQALLEGEVEPAPCTSHLRVDPRRPSRGRPGTLSRPIRSRRSAVLQEDRSAPLPRLARALASQSIRPSERSPHPCFAGRPQFAMTTSQQGSPRAMVPIGNFEKVMPLDILPDAACSKR